MPIGFIGSFPPPLGGVTVHNRRLVHVLQEHHKELIIVNPKMGFGTALRRLSKQLVNCSNIHISISNTYLKLVLIYLFKIFRKKVSFVTHGDLTRHQEKRLFRHYLECQTVKTADYPFALNTTSYELANKLNPASKQTSAYLPPNSDDICDAKIDKFFNTIDTSNYLVACTNASNVTFDKNGDEIYGIIDLVKVFREIPSCLLLISDPSGNYIEFVHKELDDDLTPNIFFIEGEHSFCAVLDRADIFIRATSTDGDSLSVKEALDLETCVLATNVVDRPPQCHLFDRNKFSEVKEFVENYLPDMDPETKQNPSSSTLVEHLLHLD